MGLSRRTLRVLLALGVVVGLVVGLGAAIHLQESSGEYSGQGYVGASDNGPQVALPADGSYVNLGETPPSDHELRIETDVGNGTFVSHGYTEANADQLEGDWTKLSGLDVTGAELYIDPDDKPAANISGNADTFEFRENYGVDNGEVDFIYSGEGGTTTVTIRGVPADTQIGAVNQHGTLLAASTSDSSGTITFADMENSVHEVQLITSQNGPEISNPSPTGDLDSSPSEISFDVNDPDFDSGGSVDVTVTLDGSEIHSETVTQEKTVTASIPSSGQTGGAHDWQVEAVDDYGSSVTESYTYRVPDTLYIRNEQNTSELINGETEVTVQFFGEDEVYERSTTDGTISLEGLPVDQDFSVQADAGNYTSRTVYIKSLYDQQSIYLLEDSADTISSRFVLNDPTGQFPSQTVLYISKPIETDETVRYETVHADDFGVEGVTATLESGNRYRLRIEAPDGTTQDMGSYRGDVSETIELRPSGPAVEFDQFDEDQNWGLGANIEEDKLFVRYDDPEFLTDRLTIAIHERGNESNMLEASETYYDLGELNSQYQLTENQSDMQWVVNFEIDRDGDTMHKKEIVSKHGNLVPSGLGDAWRHVIGVGLLLLSAGAFSLLNRSVGAVMIAIQGGLLWWTGWLAGATVGAAVVIYLFIAVGYAVHQSRTV